MRRRFEGKVAIVTGSGRGIGRATVLGLAREGARCCVTARTVEDIEAVASQVRASGGEAIAVKADVGDTAQVVNMIEKTVEAFGRLDVLVNNAAGGPASTPGHSATILECTEEEWDATINATLTSVFRVSHYSLPHIIKSGGGSIINVSSTRGLTGRKARVGYGAAKAGVINLTRCMALDLVPYNVRVNCVCPGHVESEYMKATADIIRDPLKRGEILSSLTPAGCETVEKRLEFYEGHPEQLASVLGTGFIGYPDELANAIIFLASEDASFVNGDILVVDGGSSAGK